MSAAAELARALGFKRSGNQWKGCCVAHDDSEPSMIIFDGKHAPQVRCFAGCDPLDIIDALRARGLWDGNGSEDPDDERRAQSTPRTDPNRHQVLALRIWDEAVDPTGTPADNYLRGRSLALPAGSAIRYRRDCPRGGGTAPALIALMRNVETFAPQAIQRLFLAEDPDSGFIVKTEAMMLGPVGQAAMMITSRHDTFLDCLSFCPRLYVCEGLETGLALHQAGHRPIWALGSAGAIARLPVLFAVGHLVICADNDDSSTGISAAIDCAKRWNATTHQKATVIMPGATNSDFADMLTGA